MSFTYRLANIKATETVRKTRNKK